MKIKGRTRIVVGRLLCREIRDFLKAEKFKGRDIEFWESSGFLEREFIIKGEVEDVLHIHNLLKRWASEE